MCHEWWTRRERRREEEFDAKLRYLLDEREHAEPVTVVEQEDEAQPTDPERFVEAGTRG